jgi:hypothetical protein
MTVLPLPPSIKDLPIVVNLDVSQTEFLLKGQRLDLFQRLALPVGSVQLDPPAAGQTERRFVVRLPLDGKAGTSYAIQAYVRGAINR